MSALLATVILASAAAVCFEPSDHSVGWKRVALPSIAPSLSAPPGVPQFRTDDRGRVSVELDPFQQLVHGRVGSLVVRLNLPVSGTTVELDFLKPLDGAKVDVIAYQGAREYPLFFERRVRTAHLSFEVQPHYDQVMVRIHHHLRQRPIVRTARVFRFGAPGLPPAFRFPLALYFLHPGDPDLRLCDEPRYRINRSLQAQPDTSAPVATELKPLSKDAP